MTEAYGHSVPDAAETDPAALGSSEELDEDWLGLDPLEEGIEPPERYAYSDRFGTTPREEAEGESLEDRLRQEQADVQPDEVPELPVAATPAEDLDETIEDIPADVEPVAPDELDNLLRPPTTETDQNADNAGGSVAEAIRTPADE